MELSHHPARQVRKSVYLLIPFLLATCKHVPESVEYDRLEPQGVLLVSECEVRGNREHDFLRIQLINTGQVRLSAPTTGANRGLFVYPVALGIRRWDGGQFRIVADYWQSPSFGGGEVGVRHLRPGEVVTGVLQLKQGAQYELTEGRYFGELRYNLGTWASLLAAPEIDRIQLTANFLFAVPSPTP